MTARPSGIQAQLLLAEVITQALEKNCSFAIFAAERGTVSKEAAFALERQGFVRPELLEEGRSGSFTWWICMSL